MDPLAAAALDARQFARAPYSGFRVGAALEDEHGHIHTGCNIESASYGLTVCAERVAAFRAIASGARRFRRLAVAADTQILTPPCGACRQVLWELCGDIEILLINPAGKTEFLRLSSLFPRPFDATFLD
ncbi:MAG: cytidine deaminase [Bryobacteraceae bacterium]|nr:MAG: cytidine deaminase [Bryobacteraceae bacterium]